MYDDGARKRKFISPHSKEISEHGYRYFIEFCHKLVGLIVANAPFKCS